MLPSNHARIEQNRPLSLYFRKIALSCAKKSYRRIRADKTEDIRGVAGIRQAVGRKARDPARIPQQSTRPEEIARFSGKNHKGTRLTISILLKTVPTTRTYYVVGFFLRFAVPLHRQSNETRRLTVRSLNFVLKTAARSLTFLPYPTTNPTPAGGQACEPLFNLIQRKPQKPIQRNHKNNHYNQS